MGRGCVWGFGDSGGYHFAHCWLHVVVTVIHGSRSESVDAGGVVEARRISAIEIYLWLIADSCRAPEIGQNLQFMDPDRPQNGCL
jgi:hypothetical protein